MAKTNVIRLLEAEGIPHSVHSYEVGPDPLGALDSAAHLGVDPDRVFKTLVASAGGHLRLVFCLPGTLDLDLRRAAAVSGHRQVDLIRVDELAPLTGYVRGGCSPLAMKKAFPTWIDETCQLFDTIWISAGVRGTLVELAPADLLVVGQRHLPRCDLAALTS